MDKYGQAQDPYNVIIDRMNTRIRFLNIANTDRLPRPVEEYHRGYLQGMADAMIILGHRILWEEDEGSIAVKSIGLPRYQEGWLE